MGIGGGEREGAEWVIREKGEMTQALYAHMNNKIKKKKKETFCFGGSGVGFFVFSTGA
jgi:hypothetical protein